MALVLALAAVSVLLELPTHRSLIDSFDFPGSNLSGQNFNPQLARVNLWEVAWRMFRDHPWTGVGPGNYKQLFGQYFDGVIDGERIWSSAHNLYLHQLAERGLVGFAALAALLTSLLTRAWLRAKKEATPWNLWALGSMVAFIVMNLTEVVFQNELVMTFLLLIWVQAEALQDRRAGAP